MPLAAAGTAVPAGAGAGYDKTRRAIHRAVAAVTDHIEKFRFNSAVARIRELTNALEEMGQGDGAARSCARAIEAAVRLVGPMMPHLAEELWQRARPRGRCSPTSPGRASIPRWSSKKP